MRSNSGGGKGSNNLNDPTLRDRERDRGVSGEAPLAPKPPTGKPSPESGPATKG